MLSLGRSKIVLLEETKILFVSLVVGREHTGHTKTDAGLTGTHYERPGMKKAIGYQITT